LIFLIGVFNIKTHILEISEVAQTFLTATQLNTIELIPGIHTKLTAHYDITRLRITLDLDLIDIRDTALLNIERQINLTIRVK